MSDITALTPAATDLSGLNFVLSTSEGGAVPAALPADFPTLLQIHEEEPEDTGWSS